MLPDASSRHAGQGEASCLGVRVFYSEEDIEGVVAKREDYWV